MTDDNGYKKGRIDENIKHLQETAARIEGKLDANLEWQRNVDCSLAAGNERFRHIEGDLKTMKDRDRNIGIISTIGSIIAATLGITINK
jgi:hypothetical protein